MENPITILRKAREILKSDGWIIGDLKDESGAHCALGAIYEAVGAFGSEDYDETRLDVSTETLEKRTKDAIRLLAQAIKGKTYARDSFGDLQYSVWSFNDNSAYDVDEVLSKFNDAIRLAKQGS